MALLHVRELSMEYVTQRGTTKALDNVSFDLERGESLGLVGESGCGKTTLVRTLLRLLPSNGRVTSGSVVFDGQDVLTLSAEHMRRLRLERVALVTQSSMNSLDPVYRVGDQLVEGIRSHRRSTRREAWERVEELFVLVGLNPDRLTSYPHQLSGGMKQRVIIATALSLEPELIIADEPTTALDVIVQDKILRQMRTLQQQFGNSLIYVTHDISVVAETCDKVAVMYAGRIIEYSGLRQFLAEPLHPYTMGLQHSFPAIASADEQLISIPGYPPNLRSPQVGCSFAERCPFAQAICLEVVPPLKEFAEGHASACHFSGDAEELRAVAATADAWSDAPRAARGTGTHTIAVPEPHDGV
jgi:peptide/nickel transport system ATP-binding protein